MNINSCIILIIKLLKRDGYIKYCKFFFIINKISVCIIGMLKLFIIM